MMDGTILKIAVCDDSDADRKELCGMIRRWADASGHSVRVSGFPSAESFLFAYAQERAADILYVESFAHYIEIHTRAGVYRIKESIAAFEAKLSADFYRSHRSYIINLKAVERISRTSVTLAGGIAIPLARGKYDSLNRAFIERN